MQRLGVLPARARRQRRAGRARRFLGSLITGVMLSAALAAAPFTAPAWADDGGGLPSMDGTDVAVSADGFGTVGPDSVDSLLDSGVGLDDLDPVSGALVGADVVDSPTDAYAETADLEDSSLMALDQAKLAQQAQAQAQAKQQAQSSATALRPGAVPAAYEQLIINAVADYCPSMTAPILAAQLKAESGFNPNAVSPAGAEGIAQFLPSTWATQGIDGDGDGVKNVLDPADAIPAAAAYDCSLRTAVAAVPGDATSNMLSAYNAGAGAVLKYGGIPPYAETQNYVQEIEADAATLAVTDASAQTTVGADGCPTSAPGGTMLGGSATLGIEKVCEDSVAQAATPSAALAIKYELTHLGFYYSQPLRMTSDHYDCSSFATRAYEAAGLDVISGGNAPTTAGIRAAPWGVQIPVSEAQPGDLLFPEPGHVVMMMADGFVAESSHPGETTHVVNAYAAWYYAVRVDPSKA
jgi:hypothetical protein